MKEGITAATTKDFRRSRISAGRAPHLEHEFDIHMKFRVNSKLKPSGSELCNYTLGLAIAQSSKSSADCREVHHNLNPVVSRL